MEELETQSEVGATLNGSGNCVTTHLASQGISGICNFGYRWASCSRNGALYFHWRTVCLPPRIIEYLVAHELVHLCTAHHDTDFWRRLERAMPDYAARKQWLAEHGGRL